MVDRPARTSGSRNLACCRWWRICVRWLGRLGAHGFGVVRVRTSHSCTVASLPPLAIVRPSWLKAIVWIVPSLALRNEVGAISDVGAAHRTVRHLGALPVGERALSTPQGPEATPHHREGGDDDQCDTEQDRTHDEDDPDG
jgi:hypothetical protein